MVANLAARNTDKAVVESAFCRSVELGSQFCVGAFGRNLASVAVRMFSYLI
jgi:hypothetical protein